MHKSKLKLQIFYQKFLELSDFPSNQVNDIIWFALSVDCRYGCVRNTLVTPRFLPSNMMCLMCVLIRLLHVERRKRNTAVTRVQRKHREKKGTNLI